MIYHCAFIQVQGKCEFSPINFLPPLLRLNCTYIKSFIVRSLQDILILYTIIQCKKVPLISVHMLFPQLSNITIHVSSFA